VKRIVIATIAAVAMSGAASAADMSMPLKAPPMMPAPATSWTGCYLAGGYGLYNLRTQINPVVTSGINVGGEGWLGMGSVGCDYQFAMNGLGNGVVGVFGDGVGSNIHGNYSNNGFAGASGNMKMKSEWDAGGRIGYLVTPTLLGFGKGFSDQTVSDTSNSVSDISPASAIWRKRKAQNLRERPTARRLILPKKYTVMSTAIKEAQTNRELLRSEGATTNAPAGAGFQTGSGSGLDLLRQSAQEGATTAAAINYQGGITEAGYQEQAQSYELMATAADMAAGADKTAAYGSFAASAINGVAAVATL
jgi:opacity protein-like surface antigen